MESPYPGLDFSDDYFTDHASIERYMLQQGGQWANENGYTVGYGLEYHFKRYWELLWPEDSQTEWTDLILHEVLTNQFVALSGGASSWKSGTIARIALMDWSLYPECTTVIVSSTQLEDLKARIFGEVSKLWKNAKELYDWFPGHYIDHKIVITYENVEEDAARDMRNSIVGVACRTSTGRYVGLSKFAGRKNRRVWFVGDECQFMAMSFLDAQDNLISNGQNLIPGIIRDPRSKEVGKCLRGYKGIFIGNPNPTQSNNPLDLVSEPEHGWSSYIDNGKTKVYDCARVRGHPIKCRAINLDSLDSPNARYPIDKPPWPHLTGPHMVAKYSEGHESYYSQGRGVFKFGLTIFKIITRQLCDQHHAFDTNIQWKGATDTIRIAGLDAGYGGVGGDRCVLRWAEFGECVDGKNRLYLHPHWEVPILGGQSTSPEDQIAMFCRDHLESASVPPENFFFDGRGSLAMSFARIWSPKVNSVEFGGRASERPVGNAFRFTEPNGHTRPKLCHEHYSRFVAELWWSVRYLIEADQLRGLDLPTVLDAQAREWKKVAGDRIEIETKKEMKKRTGVSPDLFDTVAVIIEGARRRGFNIDKLDNPKAKTTFLDALEKDFLAQKKWLDERRLVEANA